MKIEIYDIIGQKVATLINEFLPMGYHKADFNGLNYASGVYFFRFETDDFNEVKKMILIR